MTDTSTNGAGIALELRNVAAGEVPGPLVLVDTFVWRGIVLAAGTMLVLLGSIALLAWACGDPLLIQFDSSLQPLHYNSALAVILWGLAFLALSTRRYRLARNLATALWFFGVFLAGVNVLPVNLRLDRWLFIPPHSSHPFPASGASLGMAMALLLGAIGLFYSSRQSHRLIPILIGLVFIVSTPLLLMTRMGEPFFRPFSWSLLGSISVATAGVALLASTMRRGLSPFALGQTLPLSVSLAGLVLTFGLWLGLNADQNHRISRQVQFEAASIQQVTHERLIAQDGATVILAGKWPGLDAESRKDHSSRYLSDFHGCQGVAHIDGALNLKWQNTVANSHLPPTLVQSGVGEAIAAAVHEGRFAAFRPPRSNWEGNRVLVIFAPHIQGKSGGGLLSVIRVQEMFKAIINSSVAPGYAVSITENDGEIFSRFEAEREEQNRWRPTIPLSYQDFNWRLTIWPTRIVLDRESLALPKLALLLGMLTTGLLALAVHLAQKSRERTFALEKEVRERELTQRALVRSEEKYRTLIENLGQGIFLQDCEHRYVAANMQFCRSIGRKEAEIVGATESDLFEPQRAATLYEEVRTVLAEGKTVETEEDSSVEGKRKCIRRVLTPVRDDTGRRTGVLGICWDVTEQRQLEVHVHQASKMDAIGQLAGGIAHDFNNLLTVILGNLELMLLDLPEESTQCDLAISARNAAARATSLTQRLLGFSRRHQLDWTPTILNNIVEEVVQLLQRTIDPLVRIETNCDPNLWPVQGDPAQLNQVLMNLCLNARDAIAGPGQITIETKRVKSEELSNKNAPVTSHHDLVLLSVTDTGSGMPAEVQARIYEPFFTTKEVGKGTGLGLPMVFAIVRQHKGWIECRSEQGKGTRFEIYLPRGELVDTPQPQAVAACPRRAGKETILVVDDEPMIRQLAVTTLRTCGYTILQAEDGQQAINLYSREGDHIDLVILDLTMPVLSGHEAFRHLLALNPRVRVIFVSGYAVEQLTDLEKELMAGFVNKPYRPNELIVAVEEALQHRGFLETTDREANSSMESPVPSVRANTERMSQLAGSGR